MKHKLRSFLNNFRESKILPGKTVFEMLFFFVADHLFNIRNINLSQAHILSFLIRNKHIKKDYFLDKIKFKDMVLYDYIIYSFKDMGFSRGTSFSQVEALGKCLGEIFERTPFMNNPDESDEIVSSIDSFRKKGTAYLDLRQLSQPTSGQKEENRDWDYDEHSLFEWVKVTSFASKREVYVPKQLVYWYSSPRCPEKKIKEQNTSGLASGDTKESAMMAALSECLQRHIFFKAWYHPDKGLVIETDLLSLFQAHPDIRYLHEEAEVNMLGLRVFRIESELSKTFEVYFCVLENKLTGGYYVGCSGGGDTYTVVYRSIQEALSIYTFTNRVLFNGEGEENYKDVITRDFAEGIRGNHRVIWWGHHLDDEAKEIMRSFLGPKKEIYRQKKARDSSVVQDALSFFGDFYFKVSQDRMNNEMANYSCRVILPNSYTLALTESASTPVLGGLYPQNTKAHPFP